MCFKITMFWFMLNIFLMISATSQVRGLNKSSSNNSNNFHQTKKEPSFLILKDIKGGNPPDHPNIRINSTTTARPRTTSPKNTTNAHSQPILRSKGNHTSSYVLPTPIRKNVEVDNTIDLINENEPTETTTVKNSKIEHITEKEKGDNDTHHNEEDSELGQSVLPLNCDDEKHDESTNEQQNLYKPCDTRNGLILLVQNDIKLKLFLNSKGILDKSSTVKNRNNSSIKLNDEPSTEDIMIDDFPTTIDTYVDE